MTNPKSNCVNLIRKENWKRRQTINGNLNHEAKEKVTKATKKERDKKKKASNLRKS